MPFSSCGLSGIRVEGVANAEGPSELWSELPGVLRVEIEIQEVERFVGGRGKGFGRGRGDSVDELRQGGIGDGGDVPFAEIVIVEAKDARVGSEAQFVGAVGPGQIVIDEKARGAPALHPGIVQPSEGRERRIRAAALQDDRKGRERLLEIAWTEKAFIPGKSWIEIVHKVLRKNVRVAGGEGIERLRRNRVK